MCLVVLLDHSSYRNMIAHFCQAFLQIEPGLPAKLSLYFGDIGQAMFYIAGPRLLINWLNVFSHNDSNKLWQLVYSNTLACTDIENVTDIALGSDDSRWLFDSSYGL